MSDKKAGNMGLFDVDETTEIDIQWQENMDTVRVELWKYDPSLFSADGMVDPVSLAISLADMQDERVRGELERYMENYKW